MLHFLISKLILMDTTAKIFFAIFFNELELLVRFTERDNIVRPVRKSLLNITIIVIITGLTFTTFQSRRGGKRIVQNRIDGVHAFTHTQLGCENISARITFLQFFCEICK